jgi:hypothetical protein
MIDPFRRLRRNRSLKCDEWKAIAERESINRGTVMFARLWLSRLRGRGRVLRVVDRFDRSGAAPPCRCAVLDAVIQTERLRANQCNRDSAQQPTLRGLAQDTTHDDGHWSSIRESSDRPPSISLHLQSKNNAVRTFIACAQSNAIE